MTKRLVLSAAGLVFAACSVAGMPSTRSGSDVSAASASAHPPPAEQTAEPTATPGFSLVPCPSDGTPESPITLRGDEALSCDLAAAAEGRGTTIDEELARHRMSLLLDEVTGRLAADRPDAFLGAELPDRSGGTPKLYIHGPADAFIREVVSAAPVEIEIIDNRPYSMAELDDRQVRLARALAEVGYSNWAGGADIRTGRLYASITIEPDLPSTAGELLELLPADLQSGVDLEFSETPTAVDMIRE